MMRATIARWSRPPRIDRAYPRGAVGGSRCRKSPALGEIGTDRASARARTMASRMARRAETRAARRCPDEGPRGWGNPAARPLPVLIEVRAPSRLRAVTVRICRQVDVAVASGFARFHAVECHGEPPREADRFRGSGRGAMSEPPGRTRTPSLRARRRGAGKRLPHELPTRSGARRGPGRVLELAAVRVEGGPSGSAEYADRLWRRRPPRGATRRATGARLQEGKPMRATWRRTCRQRHRGVAASREEQSLEVGRVATR